MKDKKSILIIAGEASGDSHGAHLVRELKKKRSELQFFGIGGDQMASENVETIVHVRDMAFLGFWEVLKCLPFIRHVYIKMVAILKERQPSLVLLIDYPGFNLRFAKKAKRRGVPVLYYISPQVWAWRKGRIKKIARRVDRMLVIFPFEKVFYQKEGLDVQFVGHPLKDVVRTKQSKDSFFQSVGLDSTKRTVGLLPGSREQEVRLLLPEMLKALNLIKNEIPDLQSLLGRAPTLPDDVYDSLLNQDRTPCSVRDKTYEVMAHSDVVMVASGTATLETAILGTPMVILYKMSPLSFFIGRLLVKLKNIGLVNIVAGHEIVPELIQDEAKAETIAEKVLFFLKDEGQYIKVKKDLATVSQRLGEAGGSIRAAGAVLEFMDQSAS